MGRSLGQDWNAPPLFLLSLAVGVDLQAHEEMAETPVNISSAPIEEGVDCAEIGRVEREVFAKTEDLALFRRPETAHIGLEGLQ